MPTHTPEPLCLWDRFFNRYRREVADRGTETWVQNWSIGGVIPNSDFHRDWVDYRVIDRLTGSETIERDYLN